MTDTAKAVMHRARTVHQTVFDDSPAPPEVGKVLTRRATAGTRLGAIRIRATAAAAPGSPVRVRARQATVNPSTTLPPSASAVAAQGRGDRAARRPG